MYTVMLPHIGVLHSAYMNLNWDTAYTLFPGKILQRVRNSMEHEME